MLDKLNKMFEHLPDHLAAHLVWAICSAFVGWMLSRIYSAYTYRFKKKYTKFTYFRVVRLRFKDRRDMPYYKRNGEDVFDEVLSINGCQCSQKAKLDPIKLTTSGTLYGLRLFPSIGGNSDNHPHTLSSKKTFEVSHEEPTTQLAAIGTLINGLQSPTEYWFGTTSQHDGQTLILVVDFTSLPFDINTIHDLHFLVQRNGKPLPKESIALIEDNLGGLLHATLENSKKADVIKLTFSLDKKSIPTGKSWSPNGRERE